MKDDAQKALDELEQKLLSNENEEEEALLESIIEEFHTDGVVGAAAVPKKRKAAPAARQTSSPAKRPGKKASRGDWNSMSRDDRTKTALMFLASFLSLGISGLLIFWLVNYL